MIFQHTEGKFGQIFAVYILIIASSYHGFKANSFEIRANKSICGFPGTPAYGYVRPDLEAYAEGDVVTYTCRVAYILLGSPISRCTADGSWTKDVPICDESITTLGIPFSTRTIPGHAAEMAIDGDKDTCSYLQPAKPRFWRIELLNVYKVLSVAVTMKSPDKNFTIFVVQAEEGIAAYKKCASFSGKFGTERMVLSCAEGKGIVGANVHIEDHVHTGLLEICEVEVQVEKDTGYDCGRPSRSLHSITHEPRGKKVDYGCIQGYEIKGKDYRTCLSTGQWSDEPPVCESLTETAEILQTSTSETTSNVEDRSTRKSSRASDTIMNLLESRRIERETLLQKKTVEKQEDDLDLFFKSITSSIKKLSPDLINEAKMKSLQMVIDLENRNKLAIHSHQGSSPSPSTECSCSQFSDVQNNDSH